MRKIEKWISDEELESIYSSSYWNNVEEEKKKGWWIADGNFKKCLELLKQSRLLEAYKKSEKFLLSFPAKSIIVVDLAAGIGWTTALLSKLPGVMEVRAVEISKHRLESLFEHSIKMLSGEGNKIFRYLGSFYDLKFENNSVDVIYMSQAFHHAAQPLKLLSECDRVLKANGIIILIGEQYFGIKTIFKKILSNLFRKGKLTINFYKMFPPDPILGDHYYRCRDYYSMFGTMGYSVKREYVGNEKVIYVAGKTGR
ncbi:MAG: class I SAM-dependent methyltransferase [Candidatus Riflebacteria bacterium]|nr:class I SAM-dependent methyltransferase [Candidatus Riflebacteria bacterium]